MSKEQSIIQELEENDAYGNKPVVLDIVITHVFAWDKIEQNSGARKKGSRIEYFIVDSPDFFVQTDKALGFTPLVKYCSENVVGLFKPGDLFHNLKAKFVTKKHFNRPLTSTFELSEVELNGEFVKLL